MGSRLPLKILFVVPYAPTRIRTRPYHLIRALCSLGHEVTVGTIWGDEEERQAIDDLSRIAGVRGVVAEHLPAATSFLNCLRALPGPEPLQAHFSWSRRLAERLAHELEDRSFDVVHVEHLRGVRYGLALKGSLARRDADRPALVWDSVDCITSLFRHAARQGPTRRVQLAARLEVGRTGRYEGIVAGQFDRVLLTSPADCRDLLALARDAGGLIPKAEVLPGGVDLEYFSASTQPRHPMTIVMTGKMSYHANAVAAVTFVKYAMPLVWAECPDATLCIVGKDPPREVVRLQRVPGQSSPAPDGRPAAKGRVTVTGTVEDIRPFLWSATITVAPLQYAVGIQNKILEAMACAAPVVATKAAASGVDIQAGRDLLIASTPHQLAATIVSLLRDPDARAQLSSAGRTFVESRHDWRDIASRLVEVYRETAEVTRSHRTSVLERPA